MKRVLAGLLAGLALTGCQSLGPDHRRPAVFLPATYVDAGTADERAQVEADWWKLFADPHLDALIGRALADNFDVHAAVARVEQAEAVLRESAAARLPALDLNAGASRQRASTRTGMPMPEYRSVHDLGLSTAFELDLWGRLRRSEEAARAQLLASRHARDSVRIALAGMLAKGYFGLRALDAEIAASNDALASRAEALRITASRVEGGLAAAVALHQAEGELAAAEARHAELRRQRALMQNRLGLLSGVPGLRIEPATAYALPRPPMPPPGLPADLLDARPDVRQAEAELAAANARIGVAKAAIYPRIALTGALGGESQALGDLLSGAARTWSLAAGLLLPVFDAGARQARVEQVEAGQREALAAYQKAVHTAFREVADALAEVREHAAAEQAQAQRAQAAQRTLELARLRHAAGQAAYLEVLVAQRDLYEAQLAEIASRAARLDAAVDLFKALGGGWKESADGVEGGANRRAGDPPPTPPPPRASAG